MAQFEKNKALNISLEAANYIISVSQESDYLDELAQSSDMLPNDFSTSSLLKNEGLNLTA